MSDRKVPVVVMETDVSPVPASGSTRAGWVSGTIASLAASASFTAIFDLGPDWDQYTLAQVCMFPQGPSSGLANVQVQGFDTSSLGNGRVCNFAFATTVAIIYSAVASSLTFHVRPVGRYLFIRGVNADAVNAQGATAKITVAAYPG